MAEKLKNYAALNFSRGVPMSFAKDLRQGALHASPKFTAIKQLEEVAEVPQLMLIKAE